MARLLKSEATFNLTFVIQTFKPDGSIDEKCYADGDMIENLRYVENSEVKTVSGKLRSINYTYTPTIHRYNSISTARSYFSDDVRVKSIVIDCSEQYESKLITIPCNEIIEDSGVEAIKMGCYLKYSVEIKTSLTDGKNFNFRINEGDDIVDFTYLDRGGDTTTIMRVITFTFDSHLEPRTIIGIDMDGRLREIDIIAIKSAGISVSPVVSDISKAIADSEGFVSIGSGVINEEIAVTKDTVIRGNYTGIAGNSNIRGTENETVLSGKFVVTKGISLTLDGVTLTEDALLTFDGSPEVTIMNCRIENLTKNADRTFAVNMPMSDVSTLVNIKNNYFGNNYEEDGKNSIYNFLELTNKLATHSQISGNYFAKGVSKNNDICIYNVNEDAVINITGNTWELSNNGIRIGMMGEPRCTINVEDNEYKETSDDEYAGLMLIQPYSTKTISFKNAMIIINRTKHTDKKQLYYFYMNPTDTQITEDKKPTIIVNGTVEVSPLNATE